MKQISTKRKDKKTCTTSVFWNRSWKEWTCTFTEGEFKAFLKSHGIKYSTKDFAKKKKKNVQDTKEVTNNA